MERTIWIIGPVTIGSEHAIRDLDLKVVRSTTIREVIELSAIIPPWLIVSAVSLPQGGSAVEARDGIELLRLLHQRFPSAIKWLWTHHPVEPNSPNWRILVLRK